VNKLLVKNVLTKCLTYLLIFGVSNVKQCEKIVQGVLIIYVHTSAIPQLFVLQTTLKHLSL